MSEVMFWLQVHKKKFFSIGFDRQKIIGNYIVDFYIKKLSLIIEIDGTSHNDKDMYDEKRDAYFVSQGLRIYKTSDLRVKYDLDNVMHELESFIIETYSN